MFHPFASAAAAASAAGPALNNLVELFGPSSRLYLPYLVAALGLAGVAYGMNRARLKADGEAGFFRYAFKPSVYFSPSSLVDVKIIIFNRLFTPFLALSRRAVIALSAAAVAGVLAGGGAEDVFKNANSRAVSHGFLTLAFLTTLITLASDFTTYWVHRLHHDSPVLWPFHKVHHSAETLTPLTVLRKHPVYDLIRALSNAFVVGPAQGVIFAFFGVYDMVTILGVNAVYAVFHWTGSNLRHSHIWLSYGPFWSRIFISPAQHQIHHSRASRHHNKNYGEIFALWDWIFGTLYVPAGYEVLEFGVVDANGRAAPQPHPTLKDAYLAPFRECAAAFHGRADAKDRKEETSPA